MAAASSGPSGGVDLGVGDVEQPFGGGAGVEAAVRSASGVMAGESFRRVVRAAKTLRRAAASVPPSTAAISA